MYAGQIVEQGPVREILRHPAHPYTQGLLASVTRTWGRGDRVDPGGTAGHAIATAGLRVCAAVSGGDRAVYDDHAARGGGCPRP